MWDHNLRASGAREMRQEALTRALFLVYVCFARCPVAVDLFFFCGFSPLALSSSPPPLSLSAPRRDHPRRDPRTRDPGGKRGRASRSFTFVLFPFLFLFRRLGARRVTRERRESPDFLFSDPDFLVRPPLQILSCNQSSKPVVVVVVVVAKKKKKTLIIRFSAANCVKQKKRHGSADSHSFPLSSPSPSPSSSSSSPSPFLHEILTVSTWMS